MQSVQLLKALCHCFEHAAASIACTLDILLTMLEETISSYQNNTEVIKLEF